MSTGYAIVTGADVSLAASTAKTVLAVKAGSNFGLKLTKIWLGFIDTSATEPPAVCELCHVSYATAGSGTSVTPARVYGPNITSGITAARNYTTEPTVLTTLAEFPLTPNGGTVLYDAVLGQEPDCEPDRGFALRVTAGAATVIRATMWVERI